MFIVVYNSSFVYYTYTHTHTLRWLPNLLLLLNLYLSPLPPNPNTGLAPRQPRMRGTSRI